MRAGADRQTRTADLILTKDALYHLSYISTQIRVERAAGIEPASSAWKAEVIAIIRCSHRMLGTFKMVEGEGFEPSKAEPSDLQSDPFDRSGTPPSYRNKMVPTAGIELATY